MEKFVLDYADFAEYDRRQRAIQRHVLAAFLGGVVVGFIGALVAPIDPGIYDPYVYFALPILVGATASGFGWALLATFLAVVTTLVAAMGGSALRGDLGFDAIGDTAVGLNILVAHLVVLGLLAYVTRRRDLWGDLATGIISGLMLGDIIDRATPGGLDWHAGFWPAPALGLAGLALLSLIALRRTTAGRLRAAVVACVVTGALAGALLAL
ncbi:hypothetical protein ACWDLG_07455 [Nonomuraea sp. NPDC003727]